MRDVDLKPLTQKIYQDELPDSSPEMKQTHALGMATLERADKMKQFASFFGIKLGLKPVIDKKAQEHFKEPDVAPKEDLPKIKLMKMSETI